MEKRVNIKQHYIPRLHLRKFTDSNGMLHVLDIRNGRKYDVSPAKEGYAKYFYDIDPIYMKEYLGKDISDVQIIDNAIRQLHEDVVGKVFNDMIDSIHRAETDGGVIIAKDSREKLFQFIILQTMRTPEYREELHYMCVNFVLHFGVDLNKTDMNEAKISEVIHNLILYCLVKEFHGDKERWPERFEQFFRHFLDNKHKMYETICDLNMLFLLNKTQTPFYSSDSPARATYFGNTGSNTISLVTLLNGGPTVALFEPPIIKTIFLPISSDVGVYLLNSQYDMSLEYFNRSIGIIDESNIDIVYNLNLSTAAKACKKVYSSSQDFSVLETMMAEKVQPTVVLKF